MKTVEILSTVLTCTSSDMGQWIRCLVLKLILCDGRVAQRIRRLTSNQKIEGSSPFTVVEIFFPFFTEKKQ